MEQSQKHHTNPPSKFQVPNTSCIFLLGCNCFNSLSETGKHQTHRNSNSCQPQILVAQLWSWYPKPQINVYSNFFKSMDRDIPGFISCARGSLPIALNRHQEVSHTALHHSLSCLPGERKVQALPHKEVDSPLDVIEEVLPGLGLDNVEMQHDSMYPDAGRTWDALKQKFGKLFLKKILTGAPNCPPKKVRRASKGIYKEV